MQKHSNYYFLYTLDTHCITVLHFHFKHFIEIFLGIHINVFNKSIGKTYWCFCLRRFVLNIATQLWKLQYLVRNSKLLRKIVIETIVIILKSRI